MKTKQKLDKVLELVTKKIQEEVTALIGANLFLSESENTLISKEDFFDQPASKQIAAKLDISGDIEGAGCLLVRVKDAIRLGGTLIMLPQNELEQTILNEEYNEETKDSFGEIANIIAGSYTKVFEEMYPESCRFIRKEQEIISPAKVKIDSEEPIGNQLLYQITSTMRLDDVEMGELIVLLPAAPFGLEPEKEQQATAGPPEDRGAKVQTASTGASPETIEHDQENQVPQSPSVDVGMQRKRVDSLLAGCRGKIEEEVSALLGVEVNLGELENRPVAKEQYFLDEVSGKQVLAHMKVTGDDESQSYLFVGLKDAIRIGGILIMLPPTELDSAVAEDDFSEDAKDAYGEIANIIAGVYTGFFEENYTKSLRFIRGDIEIVSPLTVDTVAETPMPDRLYYMSSGNLSIEGKVYGKIDMLFPLDLLQLEGLQEQQPGEEQQFVKGSTAKQPQRGEEGRSDKKRGLDILVLSDDGPESEKIAHVLQQSGYEVKNISFKENINNYMSESLKAVFLIMHEVNEQAFGVVIKVSSACSVPLIAAGPAWTRTKVIKAVKYGVADILLTPASEQDIQEKIDNNLVQLAA